MQKISFREISFVTNTEYWEFKIKKNVSAQVMIS